MPEIRISELTSASTPTGTEVLPIVQSGDTYKTTINSLKDALVDNLSTGAPTWTTDGILTAGHDIIAGGNDTGRVALTLNDGYGDANITFNHTGGIPDRSGSSARIVSSVDSTQEVLDFQLRGNVAAGSPVALTSVLKLYDDSIQLLKPTTLSTNGTTANSLVNKGYIDTALSGKSDVSHTHSQYSLTTHLHDDRYSQLGHTHAISDITNLQTTLDGKIGETEINSAHFTFTNDTLSLNTIQEGQIGTGAVTNTKIAANAVTADKIATNAVTNTKIADANVTFAKLTDVIDDDTMATASDTTLATSESIKAYIDSKSTFQKFSDFQDRSTSSFYRVVSYINKKGKLCAVGHGNGYDMAGNGSDYLIAGSSPEIMVPLAAGESIVNTFSNGVTGPTMYLLTNQNRVFSTGYNANGQCGRGGTTDQRYFQSIPQLDGTSWVSPNSGPGNAGHMGAVRNGQLYMWGYNAEGQLGLGDTTTRLLPNLVNTGALAGKTITKVYTHVYYGYTFVIDSNRDVYATGQNDNGQLGLGNYTNRNTFAQVPGIKADDIILSHGTNTSSSYIIDGTTLYSTGDNNVGQLGLGDTTRRNTFTVVPGVSAKTLSVSGHRSASVVCLQTDGTVKVWGHNDRGQLGLGDTTNRLSPVTLTAAGNDVVKAITHDNYTFTAILKADGTIYASGYNGYGQLGVGDRTNRNALTKIVMDSNIQFKDIALFGYNSGTQLIAIDQDNGMWGCGYNGQWSLGLNYYYEDITILAKLSIS
jgi:alpha-tubulin suppressor-like RCC1 family protein